MRPDEIRPHLKRQPFRPFRVSISDGTSYDIRHPEMAFVTRDVVVITLALGEGGVPERNVYCDPVHITGIEPLAGAPQTPPREGNGETEDGEE